jgi:Kdo2-lipid IVA lauroyltransferase/acyltransferase
MMYYFFRGFLWLLSLLHLRILYVIADGLYALIFYVFKYRKKIVLANLAQAFPEKTEAERVRIAKKFYKNFIDSFVETIKLFSTGKKFIQKHIQSDYSVYDKLHQQGKSFQMHACHQFNWEWINHHMSMQIPQKLLGVYMPISNKAFEKLFLRLRERYGTKMLPATDMKNSFLAWRSKEHVLVLVADQNPGHPGNSYWFEFLGKTAPFIKGPERYAREKGCPVVFSKSIKVKRGYYRLEHELVTENAAELPEAELSRRFVHYVSDLIRNQPENWLWSHRRWKFDWKDGYGVVRPL